MMFPPQICLRYFASLIAVCAATTALAADGVVVTAPEAKLRVELSIRQLPLAPAQLVYEVKSGDRTVVLPSALGVRLADGTTLGSDCELLEVKTQKIDDGFEQFPGKRRIVADRANEATLTLRER